MNPAGFDTLLLELDGPVAIVTLNRPEVRNALDRRMAAELLGVLDRLADPGIRAVVLTGAGGAFCSGQDLRIAADGIGSAGAIVRETWNPVVLGIRRLPKPVLAAIGGAAVGAGMSLALACDVRVAGAGAQLGFGFARIGLMPDAGTTWFLPRVVGLGRAHELVLSARNVPASEALDLGLVEFVVPDEQVLDEARQMAGLLASGPTLAYAAAKQAMGRTFELPLEDALELEADLQEEVARSEDAAEGVRAFLEKRFPAYRGR